MTICLSPEKKVKLVNACQNILCESRPSVRTVAQLLGLMISSFSGVMYMGHFFIEGLTWKKPGHWAIPEILNAHDNGNIVPCCRRHSVVDS